MFPQSLSHWQHESSIQTLLMPFSLPSHSKVTVPAGWELLFKKGWNMFCLTVQQAMIQLSSVKDKCLSPLKSVPTDKRYMVKHQESTYRKAYRVMDGGINRLALCRAKSSKKKKVWVPRRLRCLEK